MSTKKEHAYIDYPEGHASYGSCLRCGKGPLDHETRTVSHAAAIREIIQRETGGRAMLIGVEINPPEESKMDYTDSIAAAYGALLSAQRQAMEACIDYEIIPSMGKTVEDTDQYHDLHTLTNTIRLLCNGPGFCGEFAPPAEQFYWPRVESVMYRARQARWG